MYQPETVSRLFDWRENHTRHVKKLLSLVMLVAIICLSLDVSALVVNRGPYLQTGTTNSIIVRWRTDIATNSVVRYGISPTQLNQTASVAGTQTEHTVTLTGLSANTRYYYSVGNTATTLEGGNNDYSFVTSPVAGVAKPTRIWVIGDSGTGGRKARSVRDAYQAYNGTQPTDVWLMLGDNAYDRGTDQQYQKAVFDVYPKMLKQVAVWPVLGNHDGKSADSATESGPYYDIFTLPRAAEAGGIASGTEAYYSFDYGNIHFIALDSFETDRSVNGAMLTWLQNNLVANNKPWVIAFWHHPPYTKGSHDSDREKNLIDMRENALPILESYGVDLVLTGHSHSYERSMLLDGHYGKSDSLTNAMILNAGSGRADTSDGAYSKTNGVAVANEGAVYAVAGSSGKTTDAPLNHPAMYISLKLLGSMVIDVNGNQLDAVFLDSDGAVQDYFRLIKGVDSVSPVITSVTSTTANKVLVEFSESVEQVSAESLTNYAIDQGIEINAAVIQPDGRSVVLSTSALESGVQYTLAVNQVKDLTLNPIASNAQAQFSFANLQKMSFQNGKWPTSGYQGATETTLSENMPNRNFSANRLLLVDGDDPGGTGRDLAVLLRWDLDAVPDGALIQSASITLNVSNRSPETYPLFQMLTGWVETEATWTQAQNGESWSTTGASGSRDRGSTVLGTLNANNIGVHTLHLNTDGLKTIQDWIDGNKPNYGFMIASTNNSNGIDFLSSNAAIPGFRPRLDINYSVASVSSDTIAPSSPENLAHPATPGISGVSLRWNASTDNVGVAGYKVYRDAIQVADVTTTAYTDNQVQPGTTYRYTISAYDVAGNESAQSTALSVTTSTASDAVSIDIRVSQPHDDAEEAGDGKMNLGSSDLELTAVGSNIQTVGIRFADIQIPQNATILNAYVQFEVDEVSPGASGLIIRGEAVADASAYRIEDFDITSRPATDASVSWNPPPWQSVDAHNINQRTPDLSKLVKEIVSRPDWQSGNHLAFIVSGTGRRTSESFNGEATAAPLLHIEYTTAPPPVNQELVAVFSNTPQQGLLTVDFDASPSTSNGSTIVSYAWDFGDGQTETGVAPSHTYNASGGYQVQLTVTDDQGATAQSIATVTVGLAQHELLTEHGVIANVSNQEWTTVTLANQYNSMVVVATPVYTIFTPPLVTRIRNAVNGSFEIQVQVANATAAAVNGISVHYLVMEEGSYNIPDHGVKLEAVKLTSSVTDSNSSWVGESATYSNSYNNPVVLGQVMSINDERFSVFWARGEHRSQAPSATTLFIGKHVGEQRQKTRANETIGYIVIEAGQGVLAGSSYRAGLGGNTVGGVANNSPYTYAVAGLTSATTALLSSAAMHGLDGGWPILYGFNPVTSARLKLAIEEDQFRDIERKHVVEKAAFIVLQ